MKLIDIKDVVDSFKLDNPDKLELSRRLIFEVMLDINNEELNKIYEVLKTL
jgi:hypothetical protein